MATLPAGFEVEKQQGLTLPEGFEIEQQAPPQAIPDLQQQAEVEAIQQQRLEAIPELGQGGLLAGQDPLKGAAITPALLTTTDPRELGQILTSTFPDIGIQETKEGVIIATNNQTGARSVLNQPGLSQLDIVQGLGLAAAFTPAARAAIIPSAIARQAGAGALAAGVTQAAIEAGQVAAGGEFDPAEVALATGLGGAAEVAAPLIAPAARAIGQIPAAATQAITTAGQAISEAGEVIAPTARAIFNFQTPTKQRIAKLIEEGSTDVETARFKLATPTTPGVQPGSRLNEFLNVGGPRIQTDRVAVDAINQGFDEGVIAAVKGASKADKTKLLEMVNIMERGKKNKLFAQENRPSDVAGNTLMSRFRSIVTANKNAGKQLNVVANSLKGKQIDSLPAVSSFVDDLESIGVTLSNDLKPNFSGSDIEGVKGAENAIKQIVNRMKLTKVPDAHDVHRLKRFIDEQVTFGKKVEGLTGRTEGILKNLRRNLDQILDSTFPEYDRVNTIFAETIGAIDSLQDVAGKKLNLTGPNADKAVGTLLRRIMGNAASRVRLLDSVGDIEAVAIKHGGLDVPRIEGVSAGKNDLLTQILFVDELDAVFGPVARTSFQGQLDQALKQGVGAVTTRAGAVDIALTAAGKVAERARGINEAGAFKAIKELLKEKQ